MAKKIVKIVLCIVCVTSVISGFIYFFQKRKTKDQMLKSTDSDCEPEDALKAEDALDLSSLKFSRHYVDLR